MIQFMLTAYDGTDDEAQARRRASKEAHVQLGHQMIRSGNILFSTAILGDNDETVGSMRVMQFESREELDTWLESEPYVLNKVWQDIDVRRCRMGPAFEWVTLEASGTRLDPND
jgi:uncharacterized protein